MAHSESCKHLLASLSDYVDGELDASVCAELERHLAGCENCRVVVDTLRKTVYLYHVVAEADPGLPPDARQRLFQRLDLEEFIK